jgi:3-deoxy-D-manno-octulosonate 8-phosphate phosphatase (KDO 8-P phosphatase)
MSRPLKIRLFGMDVDGVLTDGGIYYGDSGMEMKRFSVQDGMGITLIRRAGIVPFIITARRSLATARRAKELGITEAHQGFKRKIVCLEELASRYDVPMNQIAFIGDDLSDLAVLLRVGLPIAVANANEEVRQAAKYVTSRSGGDGAVREACEYVLNLNGYGRSFHSLLES